MAGTVGAVTTSTCVGAVGSTSGAVMRPMPKAATTAIVNAPRTAKKRPHPLRCRVAGGGGEGGEGGWSRGSVTLGAAGDESIES